MAKNKKDSLNQVSELWKIPANKMEDVEQNDDKALVDLDQFFLRTVKAENSGKFF